MSLELEKYNQLTHQLLVQYVYTYENFQSLQDIHLNIFESMGDLERFSERSNDCIDVFESSYIDDDSQLGIFHHIHDINDAHLQHFDGTDWNGHAYIPEVQDISTDWSEPHMQNYAEKGGKRDASGETPITPIKVKKRPRAKQSPRKKPQKAYVLFMMHQRDGFFKEHPGANFNEFQKLAALQWKKLSVEEKKVLFNNRIAPKY